MSISEPTMIGLSDKAHALLSQMKEDNFLAEMADGYRLGIGLALAQGIEPEDLHQKRTVFSVATIDPDQEIAAAIRALIDLKGTSVYRMAERLADWGVIELAKRFDGSPIDVCALVPKSNLIDA
jgi:DNA-binding IclR family transcriptional regulator